MGGSPVKGSGSRTFERGPLVRSYQRRLSCQKKNYPNSRNISMIEFYA
jgi:hypothetical protein